MKVLVCGGRDFTNWEVVKLTLDEIDRRDGPITDVIHGCGSGADRLGEYWAVQNLRDVVFFPPDWRKHGRAAGPIRNAQMLRDGNPDLVVAFPGGKGTAHMVSIAERAGVPVKRVG